MKETIAKIIKDNTSILKSNVMPRAEPIVLGIDKAAKEVELLFLDEMIYVLEQETIVTGENNLKQLVQSYKKQKEAILNLNNKKDG